jgi:hypothetical protein
MIKNDLLLINERRRGLGIGLAEKPKVSPLKKSVGSPQPEWL